MNEIKFARSNIRRWLKQQNCDEKDRKKRKLQRRLLIKQLSVSPQVVLESMNYSTLNNLLKNFDYINGPNTRNGNAHIKAEVANEISESEAIANVDADASREAESDQNKEIQNNKDHVSAVIPRKSSTRYTENFIFESFLDLDTTTSPSKHIKMKIKKVQQLQHENETSLSPEELPNDDVKIKPNDEIVLVFGTKSTKHKKKLDIHFDLAGGIRNKPKAAPIQFKALVTIHNEELAKVLLRQTTSNHVKAEEDKNSDNVLKQETPSILASEDPIKIPSYSKSNICKLKSSNSETKSPSADSYAANLEEIPSISASQLASPHQVSEQNNQTEVTTEVLDKGLPQDETRSIDSPRKHHSRARKKRKRKRDKENFLESKIKKHKRSRKSRHGEKILYPTSPSIPQYELCGSPKNFNNADVHKYLNANMQLTPPSSSCNRQNDDTLNQLFNFRASSVTPPIPAGSCQTTPLYSMGVNDNPSGFSLQLTPSSSLDDIQKNYSNFEFDDEAIDFNLMTANDNAIPIHPCSPDLNDFIHLQREKKLTNLDSQDHDGEKQQTSQTNLKPPRRMTRSSVNQKLANNMWTSPSKDEFCTTSHTPDKSGSIHPLHMQTRTSLEDRHVSSPDADNMKITELTLPMDNFDFPTNTFSNCKTMTDIFSSNYGPEEAPATRSNAEERRQEKIEQRRDENLYEDYFTKETSDDDAAALALRKGNENGYKLKEATATWTRSTRNNKEPLHIISVEQIPIPIITVNRDQLSFNLQSCEPLQDSEECLSKEVPANSSSPPLDPINSSQSPCHVMSSQDEANPSDMEDAISLDTSVFATDQEDDLLEQRTKNQQETPALEIPLKIPETKESLRKRKIIDKIFHKPRTPPEPKDNSVDQQTECLFAKPKKVTRQSRCKSSNPTKSKRNAHKSLPTPKENPQTLMKRTRAENHRKPKARQESKDSNEDGKEQDEMLVRTRIARRAKTPNPSNTSSETETKSKDKKDENPEIPLTTGRTDDKSINKLDQISPKAPETSPAPTGQTESAWMRRQRQQMLKKIALQQKQKQQQEQEARAKEQLQSENAENLNSLHEEQENPNDSFSSYDSNGFRIIYGTKLELATIEAKVVQQKRNIMNIFGVTCHAFLANQCHDKICLESHNYKDCQDVLITLKSLSLNELHEAYKFMYDHFNLHSRYFEIFCMIFGSLGDCNKLLNMVMDCERYEDSCAQNFYWIFRSLVDCGMNEVEVCRELLRLTRRHYSSEVCDGLINVIIESNWTLFGKEIEFFLNLPYYRFRANCLIRMAPAALQHPSAEYAKLLFQCILKSCIEEIDEIKQAPIMARVISKIKQL